MLLEQTRRSVRTNTVVDRPNTRPSSADALGTAHVPDHQQRIYLSPPHMSPMERRLLLDAFDSNWIAPVGPHIDALEQEFASYLGLPATAAVSSGTAALHLALRLIGAGPGDTVLTSTLTFAATANAITYVGAEPVFIDSEPATWNMSADRLEAALRDAARQGSMPKAVLVVDLYGQCADYEAIEDLCHRHHIPLIEDAAEALGACYAGRHAGTFGRIGCFSLNGNKIITAGGGGMLVAHDAELCEQARFLATQARDPAPHYQHSQIGHNYRMSNLLAAVARGQLRVLDDRVRQRRANYERYRQALGDLPGLAFMPEPVTCHSTRWLTCITIDPRHAGTTRNRILEALSRHNIEARPVWKPLHRQPVFARCRSYGGQVAEALFATGLCLPSGSNLTREQQQRVVDVIRRAWGD